MKITNFSPLKDSTSNSDSSFEMGKKMFYSIQADLQKDTNTKLTKKWIGGNKDSFNYIKTKSIKAIGVVSFDGKLSYHSKNDMNFVNSAISRTRAGGAIVPPKFGHKYLYYLPSMTGEGGDSPPMTPTIQTVSINNGNIIITINEDVNANKYYYSYTNLIDTFNEINSNSNGVNGTVLTIPYYSGSNKIYIYSSNLYGNSGILTVDLSINPMIIETISTSSSITYTIQNIQERVSYIYGNNDLFTVSKNFDINSKYTLYGLKSNTEYTSYIKAILYGNSIVQTLNTYTLANTPILNILLDSIGININISNIEDNVIYKYTTNNIDYDTSGSFIIPYDDTITIYKFSVKAINLGGQNVINEVIIPTTYYFDGSTFDTWFVSNNMLFTS
jgi:hypothetical protein